MSIFSDLLGKHIAAKAIKSNEMAQFCGIERSFMYKIIKGTRHVANMDTVLLMAEYLRLTPSERNDFIESYKISVDGLENYYRRKSILELFENFKIQTFQNFMVSSSPGRSLQHFLFPLHKCRDNGYKLIFLFCFFQP